MGRREKPLDPTAGPVERFAHELRELRRRAGAPTYRALAARVPYAAATLSEAAAGERLPSLPVALAYVRACGGEESEWERRWREAATQAEALSFEQDDGDCPYPGLARFEPDDHERFFGREHLVADLVGLVRDRRFAVLVGASGSGKSSLLRAGLIPTLRHAESTVERPAAIRILTPGERPLHTHARALAPAAGTGDTWVLMDQFEELFTLCQDREERTRFFDALLAAVEPGSRLRVVISLRADFYGRLAEHAGMADAVRETTLLVAPMSREELRAAIVKPAASQGLIVERALTTRVVADVEGEPGGLPLMSHALRETWRRRRGRALTLADYEAAGGVHGAIARTAEQLYAQLTAKQGELTRHLLLRLITPGDGAQDTRRPAPRTELDMGDPADARLVLDQLAQARLITLDQDIVDLAHEALITSWPRLHSWIDADRERIQLHRRLTEAAAAWEELDRDAGALYRGSRLQAVTEAFPHDSDDLLTAGERAFLTASLDARDRERRDAARTTRRLRVLSTALSLLLVLSLIAAGTAVWQRDSAIDAQRAAQSRQLAAQSTSLLANDPDLASLLAVQAYRAHPTAEAIEALLGAAALPLRYRREPDVFRTYALAFETSGALLSVDDAGIARTRNPETEDISTHFRNMGLHPWLAAFNARASVAVTVGQGGRYGSSGTLRTWDVASEQMMAEVSAGVALGPGPILLTPDGSRLITNSRVAVEIRDTTTGRLLRTIGESGARVSALAYASEGEALAISDSEGRVRIQSMETGEALSGFIAQTEFDRTVQLSPDGRTITMADDADTVRLMDVSTGDTIATLPGHEGFPRREASSGSDGQGLDSNGFSQAVIFSPDGANLVTADDAGTVRLWDAASGELLETLAGHRGNVRAMAFSQDGATLASADDYGVLRLWDLTGGRRAILPHAEEVATTVFSPEGASLVTLDNEGTLHQWDTTRGEPLDTRASDAQDIVAADFSSDGNAIATMSTDGTIRVTNEDTGRSLTDYPSPFAEGWPPMSFGPDDTVATIEYDDTLRRYTVRLWNTATGRTQTLVTDNATELDEVVFSPDGTTAATVTFNGTVRLIDVATGRTRATYPSATEEDSVGTMAFSGDGETLAIARTSGTIHIWQASQQSEKLQVLGHGNALRAIAVSPDGTVLATVSQAGAIRLWDITTGHSGTVLPEGTSELVAFSPTGNTLVTSHDGNVELWEMPVTDPERAIQHICQAVNRDLTTAEQSSYLPDTSAQATCGI